MDQVRLPDLEVIRRYSIAVRRERAPVEEVLEALRADLDSILRASSGRPAGARSTTRSTTRPAPRSTRSATRSTRGGTKGRR